MTCFKEELRRTLDIMYDCDGHEMARRFYIPVLRLSKEYDRVSGYFSVDSLVVVAAACIIYNFISRTRSLRTRKV